ncbi:MAG TPA: heavy-metal-associated domain-containing protein [Saprospiraceae bacterium]|nr:heavy-metal-associated domain-containing protein [Saprospiraceae bacterium]HQW95120.1 heavy-metal-associated domain-containing protein [Saprospiraceae bacterium]
MDNKVLKFKTNINCSGCVSRVTTFLNESAGPEHWSVDTANQDKILTVEHTASTENAIIESVKKAGFQIEIISV